MDNYNLKDAAARLLETGQVERREPEPDEIRKAAESHGGAGSFGPAPDWRDAREGLDRARWQNRGAMWSRVKRGEWMERADFEDMREVSREPREPSETQRAEVLAHADLGHQTEFDGGLERDRAADRLERPREDTRREGSEGEDLARFEAEERERLEWERRSRLREREDRDREERARWADADLRSEPEDRREPLRRVPEHEDVRDRRDMPEPRFRPEPLHREARWEAERGGVLREARGYRPRSVEDRDRRRDPVPWRERELREDRRLLEEPRERASELGRAREVALRPERAPTRAMALREPVKLREPPNALSPVDLQNLRDAVLTIVKEERMVFLESVQGVLQHHDEALERMEAQMSVVASGLSRFQESLNRVDRSLSHILEERVESSESWAGVLGLEALEDEVDVDELLGQLGELESMILAEG